MSGSSISRAAVAGLVVAGFLGVAAECSASAISFTNRVAGDDGYVDLQNPGTNFGAVNNALIRPSTYENAYNNGKFPLYQWDLDLPAGEKIESVESAVFRVRFYSTISAPATLAVWRLSEAFDESTVTYNSKPARDASLSVSFPASPSTTDVYIDVAPLLANNGDLSTFGLVIVQTGGSGSNGFYNKEYTSNVTWPVLTASYTTAPVPEPTSVALVSLAVPALLGRRRRTA